jgi:restriction system protein
MKGGANKNLGPRFVAFFGPVLDALRSLGSSGRPQEVYDIVARELRISDDELNATNKGGNSKFENRVAWARFYLAKAGLIDSEKRGVWVLTEKGKATHLDAAQSRELFKEVQAAFRQSDDTLEELIAADSGGQAREVEEELSAPDDDRYVNEDEVRAKLVEILRGLSPKGFEEFCARVLRHTGFENVITLGGKGDRGIDGEGYLLLNRFVRSKVLFQCKRYEQPVGPEKVRDFRGAIQGRADRGIFLTTSTFTRDARAEAVRENATPIELVDIERLIDIMLEEKLGIVERKALQLSDQFFEVYR